MSHYNINLNEVIYSLSSALDLVGVDHIHHGRRVAYMATEIGKILDWPSPMLDDLFQSSILHDCGVSRTSVHAKLAQLEWENEPEHCTLGAEHLSSSHLLKRFAPIIQHHHHHWGDLKNAELPEEMKLIANCIYLADRADILAYEYLVEDNFQVGMNYIRRIIAEKSDDWFCPDLVDTFMTASSSELFWQQLESNSINSYVRKWVSRSQNQAMSFEQLRSLISIFSYIVDAKSPFTENHSQGVANLARYLGTLLGLSEPSCESLELAGLLHDIGKLRVPDEILEKSGILSESELIIMRHHILDSHHILKSISGLEHVAQWAVQHHERVDGSGYPYHLAHDDLSVEARIIAVADVFQALAQNRPYREALHPKAIVSILTKQAEEGKLDPTIVAKIEENLQACWEKAMSHSQYMTSSRHPLSLTDKSVSASSLMADEYRHGA